ncbi:hypothetical protein niasHS_011806 [Heterodera schachtii]|uniref:DNA-directed DNA polymerase n=1 Tax=Heterodera schachtii TaxID=97005 RepID=A0ABD2IGV3_HETSC
MEENRSRTEIRMEILREKCKNFSIGEVWECDVNEELKRNKEMKKFFESVPDKGPINPRDAYAGGRTMPFCLYAKATEEIEISISAKNEFVMTKDVKKCNHRPAQRAFLGTFTSIDLRKALELGYRVIGFYRAYHFEQFDSQLFKGYVRMFLKIKVEASGWPAEGLNSLWGKFSMRNTLSNTEIVGSMERWMKLRRDNTIEFGRPVKISEELSRVVYRKKEAFIKEHKVSNIVLSLWTTSAARIKLYEYMEQVNKEEGSKLLYCDTDSLAFAHRKGRCPLVEGKFGFLFVALSQIPECFFQAVRVQPMQQPIPLRDVPLFANPPPNVPGIRVEPIHEGQQPIPLRVLPQIFHHPPNVPAVRVQPVQQPMPLKDMPQIHHPPRNAIHVRQIQRDYAIPQFAHPPPNVPLIFDHPPAIQPRQQPLPLRDVLQIDHPLPHGPPNHPNPPRVLEVIRRLREWRGRPQDPRRPPQWMI